MAENSPPITLARLQVLVQIYGASPERWPAEERRAATNLIATSARARNVRDEALLLDQALETLRPPAPSADFLARLRTMLQSAERKQPDHILLSGTLRRAAAIAIVALSGFTAGLLWPSAGRDEQAAPPRAQLEQGSAWTVDADIGWLPLVDHESGGFPAVFEDVATAGPDVTDGADFAGGLIIADMPLH